jgi:hypothetical protein
MTTAGFFPIIKFFTLARIYFKEAAEMLRSFSAEIIAGATINAPKGRRMTCQRASLN